MTGSVGCDTYVVPPTGSWQGSCHVSTAYISNNTVLNAYCQKSWDEPAYVLKKLDLLECDTLQDIANEKDVLTCASIPDGKSCNPAEIDKTKG